MSCLVLVACTALVFSDTAIKTQGNLSHTQELAVSPPDPSTRVWYDNWQQEFSESMDSTARQLDSFFALDGSDTYEDARAEGRIRFGLEPRSRDLMATDLKFRIRVKLPALQDRVDLMLSDDEDEEQEDTIKAARAPAFRDGDSTTLSLRFKKQPDSHFSHRIGAGRRDQLYIKSRYANVQTLTNSLALKYDAEAYYYTRDQFGAVLGTSLQYLFDGDKVLRFNNRFYYRDISKDWLWRHELQYLKPLTDNSAAIYSIFTEGVSQPTYRLEEVYSSVRWRTNPLREWLFFEVEPFVLWLRNEDFDASIGIALRVEVYYGKTR